MALGLDYKNDWLMSQTTHGKEIILFLFHRVYFNSNSILQNSLDSETKGPRFIFLLCEDHKIRVQRLHSDPNLWGICCMVSIHQLSSPHFTFLNQKWIVNWLIDVGCMFCVHRLCAQFSPCWLLTSQKSDLPEGDYVWEWKRDRNREEKWADSLNWVGQDTCRSCNSRPKAPTEAPWWCT